MRVKRGTKRTKRRKKILKQAKGYYGAKSRNYKSAKEAVERSMQFAYRDRRNRKRDFRRLWIVRINAGARQNGLSYNRFMHGLQLAGCELNRKMLADLAARDPEGFAELSKVARQALGMTDAPTETAAPAGVEQQAPEKPTAAKKAPEKAKAEKDAKAEVEAKPADEPKAEQRPAEKAKARKGAVEKAVVEPAEAGKAEAEDDRAQEPAAEAAEEPAEK